VKYINNHRERIRVVEVFLPKRIHYLGKLAEVLRAFEDMAHLRLIPQVKHYAQFHPEHMKCLKEELQKLVTGFSILEVDGRYMGASGPIDERSMIIRIIIRDGSIPGMSTDEFLDTAETVIHHLIAGRFARELASEEEVWLVSFDGWLTRWTKQQPGEQHEDENER